MAKRNLLNFLLRLKEETKGFFILIRSFEGWYNFVLLRYGVVSYAFLKRKGDIKNLESVSIDAKLKIISIKYNKKTIKFYYDTKRQLDNSMKNIYQTFMNEQYGKLNVKGKKVIDIGTNNGDSAIFFVSKGASKVYAYEPYPYMLNLAKKNIILNKMEKWVELKNQAVLGKAGYIKIDEKYESINTSLLENFSYGKKIKVESLDDIVKKYKLNNAVLKIDCEGGEYDILNGAGNDTIRRFGQIALEYHFGYEVFLKRLRGLGFKVWYTEPKIGRNAEADGVRMDYGMLYANKKAFEQK